LPAEGAAGSLAKGRPAPRWSDVGIGLGVLAVAGVAAWQTTLIATPSYAKVGPTVIPWMTVALLAVLGAMLTYEGWRGGWTVEGAEPPIDRRSVAWLALGLLLNVLLIKPLGFILASSVLFALTARAFGSRRIVRDAGIGFALALLAYVGFDRLLGYRIGTGLVENLVRSLW